MWSNVMQNEWYWTETFFFYWTWKKYWKVHSYINSIALGKKNLLSQKVRIILAKASPRRRINFFYTQCSASLPSFSCFKTLCIRCICVRKLSSNFFVHLLNKKKEVVWVLFHFFQRGHRWMFTAHSMHILFIFLPTLSAFGRYIQVPCSSIPKGGFYRV